MFIYHCLNHQAQDSIGSLVQMTVDAEHGYSKRLGRGNPSTPYFAFVRHNSMSEVWSAAIGLLFVCHHDAG